MSYFAPKTKTTMLKQTLRQNQMIQVLRELKRNSRKWRAERKPEDVLNRETGFQSEGTEQEGETDEDPE
ncbi:Hypothetical protein SMAX5B_015949, partial [Scophthalmus maximus]